MTATSFTGTPTGKVDSKGRTSIPAEFRPVLEAGDATREAGAFAGVMVSYSPHLKGHFRGYTVDRFEAIGRDIQAIRPATPEENKRKQMALRMHFGHAVRLDIDREGRVVMPAALRARLGAGEGAGLAFRGMGDSFEIWNAADFVDEDADLAAFLAAEADFDPTALAAILGQ